MIIRRQEAPLEMRFGSMSTYRPAKMASLVREIVSDAIAQKLNDPRISPLSSVTRVEISGDLQVAKVYISVIGTDAQGRTTIKGLSHAAGHVQRLLSKHWHARHCPEIRFFLDESIKGSLRTIQLIDESLKDAPAGDESADPDAARTDPGPVDGARE